MQTEKPVWLKITKEELEALVLKLHAEGMPPEKIGIVLRDSYGVPSASLVSRKITQIISEKEKIKPSDLSNLESKKDILKKHLEKNKQDKVAKKSAQITQAKINKVRAYHKKNLSD